MNPEDESVEVGDSTPSFLEQARCNGWPSGLFDFGKGEAPDLEFFNPGLVRRPDGLWMLVRVSELVPGFTYGKNRIWACRLDEKTRGTSGGPILQIPDASEDEHFEDARAIHWNNQTYVGCCNFTWYPDGTWTGAHQMLAVFKDEGWQGAEDRRWTPFRRIDPPVETNLDRAGHTGGRHNKNWLWFFHEGKLMMLYLSDPWHMVEFGASWDEQIHHKGEGAKWKYGLIRGGTPPVLVGDLFYTFFHSSLPWRGRFRRYYMGVLSFESRPPYNPVSWSREPLLIGSQNDPWQQMKPLVVFPCGAVLENDMWFITLGINDLKCGWVEIPHEDVIKSVQSAPVAPALSLFDQKTEKIAYEPIPFAVPDSKPFLKQPAAPRPVAPAATPSAPAIDEDEEEPAPPTERDLTPPGDRLYKPELLLPEDRQRLMSELRQPVRAQAPPPRPIPPPPPSPPRGPAAEDPQPEEQQPPEKTITKEELQRQRTLANLAAGRAKATENRRLGIPPQTKKKKRPKKKR